MATSKYKFYMAECDASWNIINESRRNLEESFVGMRYLEAKGLNLVGKPKVYTETYADSKRVRVFLPPSMTYEPTKVTFSFAFFGEERYQTYDAFVTWISGKRMVYWDDARKKGVFFYVADSIQPAEEKWYGSTPFLRMELNVSNVYGNTYTVKEKQKTIN